MLPIRGAAKSGLFKPIKWTSSGPLSGLQLLGKEALQPQTRSIRKWRRALPFPPDFRNDHYMLPTLRHHLDEMEAIENPVNLVDIGLTSRNVVPQLEAEVVSKRREKMKVKKVEVRSEKDLISLVQMTESEKNVDYDKLSRDWLFSDEGKQAIVLLGHHYGIFRDLFCSPSHAPREENLPVVDLPAFTPRRDLMSDDVINEYFPGAVRIKSPEPKNIYFFTPHVPLHVEFMIPESNEDWEKEVPYKGKPGEEAFISSPVFRGNIIRPSYAREKPSVVFDVRGDAVNAAESIDPYGELLETGIKIIGHNNNYFTLALLNLDSQFGDTKPLCHWMVSNINKDAKTGQVQSEEVISYLAPFGFQGFGYHRMVFVLFQHQRPMKLDAIDDYILIKRLFDPLQFLKQDMRVAPVGLSWFQTTWDSYSQHIFHNILDMRVPTFEWIQPEYKKNPQVKYPKNAPFNIYLDHYRDPKEVNKSVLLERLKSLNVMEYDKAFEVNPLPNLERFAKSPSWLQSTEWKRRNRLGPFRNLRPASATIPLNNNADLDRPIWPYPNKLELPMKYPDGTRRPKPLRETKWHLPPHEHPTYRIEHQDIHEEMKKLEKKE